MSSCTRTRVDFRSLPTVLNDEVCTNCGRLFDDHPELATQACKYTIAATIHNNTIIQYRIQYWLPCFLLPLHLLVCEFYQSV